MAAAPRSGLFSRRQDETPRQRPARQPPTRRVDALEQRRLRLVEPGQPEVVLPPHPDDRAHPREAVEHHRDERPVTQTRERARVDRIEKAAGFGRREHRRRALGDNVLRPLHGRRGVHGRTWLTTSQSPSMRIAATCCFDRGRCSGLGPEHVYGGGYAAAAVLATLPASALARQPQSQIQLEPLDAMPRAITLFLGATTWQTTICNQKSSGLKQKMSA